MDLSKLDRNAPCPCGSGKKFKKCHLGREAELSADVATQRINQDPYEAAQLIMGLPACQHPRALAMAAGLAIVSPAGKNYSVKLVDLQAYLDLGLFGQEKTPAGDGGVLINPQKTKLLEPGVIYVALSPSADESTVLHQLAHAVDLIKGSSLPPGRGQALSYETELPVELLEHPQEFGDLLVELSQGLGVELDAEDEIVAILARRQLLLPGKLIGKGEREPLVAAAEKALRYLRENQEEIDARIKSRQGYLGSQTKG